MNKKAAMSAVTLSLLLLLPVFLASAFDVAHVIPNVVDFGINYDMLTVASISEPVTVDPAWASDAASETLIMNVYETLVGAGSPKRTPRAIVKEAVPYLPSALYGYVKYSLKWDRLLPLKIYADAKSKPYVEFAIAIWNSFRWMLKEKGAPPMALFELVTSEADANVKVYWKSGTNADLGNTDLLYYSPNRVASAIVSLWLDIGNVDPDSKLDSAQEEAKRKNTATHELGHVLLLGHRTDQGKLMSEWWKKVVTPGGKEKEEGGTTPIPPTPNADGETLKRVAKHSKWDPSTTGSIVPRLAEEWDVSIGGLTYTFEIRSGVQWQDGSYGTVTAEDVEYSIERVMVLDHVGGPAWMFYQSLIDLNTSAQINLADPIEAAFLGADIDDAVTVIHNATGDYVQFNLVAHDPVFLEILAHPWASIMSKQWAIAKGAWPGFDNTGYVDWRDYNHRYMGFSESILDVSLPGGRRGVMMGSGPYKFIEWAVGDYWMIERFPGYWRGWSGPGDYVTRVRQLLVEDWTTRKSMFLSDNPAAQADLVDVPSVYVPEIEGQLSVRGIRGLPTLAYDAVFFNLNVSAPGVYFTLNMPRLGANDKPDLLSDIHMREAFAYCFDYDLYITDPWLGQAQRPYGAEYYYNLTEATYHFKMAWGGVDTNPGPPNNPADVIPGDAWNQGFEIAIAYNAGNVMREVAADMIKSAIDTDIPNLVEPWGVMPNIDVLAIPWGAVYVPAMTHYELPMFIGGWMDDYENPLLEYAMVPLVQPVGQHWERDWVQGWHDAIMMASLTDTSDPTSTRLLYFYDLWKGLDADVTGPSDLEPHKYGYVDSSDAQVISYHWNAEGFPPGPGGYSPKADIYPVMQPDGLVDLSDAALITAQWHDYVVPNPNPP